MLSGPLDIAELVRTGATWRGVLPLDEFERFGAAVNSGSDVEVAVRFVHDDLARARVTGRCGVLVELVCAHCACEADVRVECAVDFRLVACEAQARTLPPAFDTVVAAEDRVAVPALVEDDLLLNLPEVGCTDRDGCANWAEQHAAEATAQREPRASPFAALGALKGPDHEPGN